MRSLLAMLVLSCTGCAAQWCHLPDDCAHAFNQTQLGWELQDIRQNGVLGDAACGDGACGDSVACGIHVSEEAVWLDDPCDDPCDGPYDEPELAHRRRIAVGPPPESYVPPMPPKFLPVPVRPVF